MTSSVSSAIRPSRVIQKTGVWGIVGLSLILILATGLRLHKITLQGFWYDELDTLETVAGRNGEKNQLPRDVLIRHAPVLTSLATAKNPLEVVRSLKNDAHPPLYFLLLRAWMDAFGSSDYAVRFFSVVCSVLAIIGLYDAVRLLHGKQAALWACLIMALAMPQIRYAQEARMYAMAIAWEMLAIAAVVRIEKIGINARRLTALGAGLLGMMFTSYFCAPVCLAIGVYLAFRLRGRARRTAIGLCLAIGIAFLATCGPLMIAQRHVMAEPGYYWAWDYAPGHWLRTLYRAGSIPFRLMQQPLSPSAWWAEIGAVLFFLPYLMLRLRPDLLLWGLILIAPVLFIMGVDFYRSTNQLTQIRYLLTASPAVYALVASLLLSARWKIIRWSLPAVAVLGCIIALPVAYQPYKIDFKPAANYLSAHVQSDDPIVFAGGSWGPYFTGRLYLGFARYAGIFPRPIVFLDAPASARLMRQLRPYRRVWFFCAGPEALSHYLPGMIGIGGRPFLPLGYLYEGKWPTSSDSGARTRR